MANKGLVSVIITTRNSEQFIRACLESIKRQKYTNIEIIVVDNFSKDNTVEIAGNYTRKLFNRRPERSAQRNYGAQKAKGKYLLFIDSDMVLSEGVIAACVGLAESKRDIAAIVIPEESFGEGFWTQCKKLERSFYVGQDSIAWLEGARFYRRQSFNFVKGYDEQNTGTEDFDLPQRIEEKFGKSSIVRIKEFIYHNEGKLSLFYTLKKKFYYGKDLSKYKTGPQNKEHFKKQSNILSRYKIFFAKPHKLFREPLVGIGMLFMKTAEFTAGGLGYLNGVLNFGFIKKYFSVITLLTLSIVILISHTLYVLKTFQYPTWDEHHYLNYGIQFYNAFRHPNLSAITELGDIIKERQPFYSVFIALGLFIFGAAHPYKVALFINVFFHLTTIIAVYIISTKFFSRLSGVLAAIMYAFYGFPLFYLHFTYTETAATAFITLAILYSLLSENFTNRKHVILFSISFAAALLTRWTSPVFIMGSLFYAILSRRRYINAKLRPFIYNATAFFVIGIAIPLLVYYIPKYDYISGYMRSNIRGSAQWVITSNYLPAGLENTFSIRSIMFYFNILSQQTVFLFCLFAAGFLICIFYLKKYFFLIIAFVVPYSFFTFITVFKDDRFILPIYPVMAIISSAVFIKIKNPIIKLIIVALTVALSLLNFLGASWGIGPLGKQGLKDIVLPSFIHHPRRIYLTTMVWPPRENTNAAELLAILYKLNPDVKHPAEFLHIYRYDILESAMANIALYEKPELLRFVQQQKKSLTGIPRDDSAAFIAAINKADFLITKNKHPVYQNDSDSDNSYWIRYFYKYAGSEGQNLPVNYQKVAEVPILTDSSTAIIFKKIQKNDINTWNSLFNNSSR